MARHKIMTHNMFLKGMGATPPPVVKRKRGKLPTKAEVIAARWATATPTDTVK